MPKKIQHYVPKTYLAQWQTMVESEKEPDKQFIGVYLFEDNNSVGLARSIDTILWKPRLYTINFDQLYLSDYCPLVYSDFVSQVYRLMRDRSPHPVYGKLGYSVIRTRESIRKHLHAIDNWEFYYDDGQLARKASILSDIHNLNSYIIEDGFDQKFESSWTGLLGDFLNELNNPSSFSFTNNERAISMEVAKGVLSFFLMMQCRSPQFNGYGILLWVESLLRNAFGDNVEPFMKSLWYTELYRLIFGKKEGFHYNMLNNAIAQCQMMVYRAKTGDGSFITSDNPAFMNQTLVPESEYKTGFFFPLTPQYLLFIGKGDGPLNQIRFQIADYKTIQLLNRIVYKNRDQVIVTSEKNIFSYI